jgi:hypothetical protein
MAILCYQIVKIQQIEKSLCFSASCTGLKAEWIGTLETTAQFPVDKGTVVEVSCSESGAINRGSSAVTCLSGTEFSYSEEPSCSKPGISVEGSKGAHTYQAHGCMTLTL